MFFLLSIDIGTTNIKAAVFGEDGKIYSQSLVEVNVYSDPSGAATQDLEEIYNATLEAARRAVRLSGKRREIGVIVFSSQMHGAAILSRDLRPLTPLFTYLDTRPYRYAEYIEREYGRKIYDETGCPPLFIYPLAKILWLKDVYEKINWGEAVLAISAKDYVISKFTGEYLVDLSTASGSQLLDIRRLKWSNLALGIAEIGEESLPQLIEGEKTPMEISPEASGILGVKPDTSVLVGVSDAASHNFGVGLCSRDKLALNIGTSAAVRVASNTPITDSRGMRFFCYYAGFQKWLVGGAINNAGLVLRWYRDNLGGIEKAASEILGENVYEIISREAELAEPVPGGLLFLPFISGERFPIRDPNIRGVIYGLNLSHGKREIIRAAMEGVAFTLRWIYEAMQEEGIDVGNIRASGGGAKHRVWRGIIADVFNLPVTYIRYENASLLGGAIVALRALGHYSSLEEAIEHVSCIYETDTIAPNPNRVKKYREAYRMFKKLYKLLEKYSREHLNMLLE